VAACKMNPKGTDGGEEDLARLTDLRVHIILLSIHLIQMSTCLFKDMGLFFDRFPIFFYLKRPTKQTLRYNRVFFFLFFSRRSNGLKRIKSNKYFTIWI
jgi:hypothetical protein